MQEYTGGGKWRRDARNEEGIMGGEGKEGRGRKGEGRGCEGGSASIERVLHMGGQLQPPDKLCLQYI